MQELSQISRFYLTTRRRDPECLEVYWVRSKDDFLIRCCKLLINQGKQEKTEVKTGDQVLQFCLGLALARVVHPNG